MMKAFMPSVRHVCRHVCKLIFLQCDNKSATKRLVSHHIESLILIYWLGFRVPVQFVLPPYFSEK